jgi:uroporphyrinogen-III synthase
MAGLEGKRIVLTGSRKIEELSTIVQKQGGIPLWRPTQGKVVIDDAAVDASVSAFLDSAYDWTFFTTGIGFDILVEAAARIRAKDAFMKKLQESWIAARGYKTVKSLQSLGLEPSVRDEDGTMAGLIRAFPPNAVTGCRVALQLYGDPSPRLTAWLSEQGAEVENLLPYVYSEPNPEDVQQLLEEICTGVVDAVTFTSTPQVRHLLAFARRLGMHETVFAAFENSVVAVAVGKVTAEALREEGVTRIVSPAQERMGSMIVELAKYYGP